MRFFRVLSLLPEKSIYEKKIYVAKTEVPLFETQKMKTDDTSNTKNVT